MYQLDWNAAARIYKMMCFSVLKSLESETMGDSFRSVVNVGNSGSRSPPLSSSVTTPASPKSPYFDLEID